MLSRLAFALVVGLASTGCSVSPKTQSDPPLTLPPPEGFCELTRQQPQDAAWTEYLSSALARANIKLLAMSADCGQLEASRARRHLVDDYAQYQTLPPAGRSYSAEWVKGYCTDVRAQGEKKLPGLTAYVNAEMEAAKLKGKFNEMAALGVLAEDADAC